MAMLGIGDYLCEACRYFDSDGNDGNHPFCAKQGGIGMSEANRAIRLGEECPYGYEFGVPTGYPVSMERNERRAYEVRAMMGRHAKAMTEKRGCKHCTMREGEFGKLKFIQGVPYTEGPLGQNVEAIIEKDANLGYILLIEDYDEYTNETHITLMSIKNCPWCGKELR